MRRRAYGGSSSTVSLSESIEDLQIADKCAICCDTMRGALVRLGNCDHIFHSQCVSKLRRRTCNGRPKCPLCRESFDGVEHGTIPKPSTLATSVYIPGTCSTVTVSRRDVHCFTHDSKRTALLHEISQRPLPNHSTKTLALTGMNAIQTTQQGGGSAGRRTRLLELKKAQHLGHMTCLGAPKNTMSLPSAPATAVPTVLSAKAKRDRVFWEDAGYI
jgi:hypothetical protein